MARRRTIYISLSPEPIRLTNAELEDVEIVVSPDHKVFSHTNPLRGLGAGGILIMQSHRAPLEVWKELPAHARKTIREKGIRLYIVDAFGVAKKHAPAPDLEIRMMGIAFIGAVCGHVDRIAAGASREAILDQIQQQVTKKFGAKGDDIVESNMSVIREGLEATIEVDYSDPAFKAARKLVPVPTGPGVAISASMAKRTGSAVATGCSIATITRRSWRTFSSDGTIGEAPVCPGPVCLCRREARHGRTRECSDAARRISLLISALVAWIARSSVRMQLFPIRFTT